MPSSKKNEKSFLTFSLFKRITDRRTKSELDKKTAEPPDCNPMAGKKHARTILDAHMSGQLPPDTEAEVLSWLAKYGNQPEYTEALKEVWDIWQGEPGAGFEKNDEEADLRFQRYKQLLGFPEDYSEGKELVERMYANHKRSRIKVVKRMRLWRIAAVVIPAMMVVGAAWFLSKEIPQAGAPLLVMKTELELKQQDATGEIIEEAISEEIVETPQKIVPEAVTYEIAYSAPAGKHRYVRLPDNTTVLVNGGSRIAFSSANREVFLQGEAFFRVEKGLSQPFLVKTGQLTVNVTGTEFNVNAWPGGEQTVVELINGSVDIRIEDKKIALRPMEELMLRHNSGAVSLYASDGRGWWREPIRFEEETLRYILEEMERYYGIQISGKENITDTVRYTIKFDKMSSAEEILDVMQEWLEYRKDGMGITVNMRETDK